MSFPLQITVRDFPNSQNLNARIRQKAAKIENYFDRIISCRVNVDMAQKNKHHGKLYNVRIDLSIPQDEIVVNRIKNENVFVALRDAFDALFRKVKSHARRIRGHIKSHELPIHGHVARLFPEDEIGFIETNDGREYYFNSQNLLAPRFEDLDVGTQVLFQETFANDGLHAVRITVGKHQPLESNGDDS